MAHQAKIRVVTKDPVEKVARQRLSVLQLSQTLGSVSAACRRMGMDRTSFYEWKRRFQTHGLEGLKDLPPVHKTHPMTTPIEVVERVLAISSDNPAWGCVRMPSSCSWRASGSARRPCRPS
jgi:transposase-like protein